MRKSDFLYFIVNKFKKPFFIFWKNPQKTLPIISVKSTLLKSFSTKNYEIIWALKIPNLLEIQRASFFIFLKFGLCNEFRRRQIWFQTARFEWTFYPQRLRLEIPIRSYQETIRLGRNYSSRLIIPRSLYDRYDSYIRFEWVILGSIPIITQQGHFLVNGSPRVCVRQFVRGPGIYTGRKNEINGKSLFYVDIVPERGVWVRLEKNNDHQTWLRVRKEPSVIIWSVLKVIGLNSIFSYFNSFAIPNQEYNSKSFLLKKKFSKRKYVCSFYKLQKCNRLTQIKKCFFLKEIKNPFRKSAVYSDYITFNKKVKLSYLTRKFSSLRIYDLGIIGRKRLNERFQQLLPLSTRCLVPTDLLSSLSELNQLNPRNMLDQLNDIDSLNTRRLRSIGNILRVELKSAFLRLEITSRQRFELLCKNHTWTLSQVMPIDAFDQTFRRFVRNNPLMQFSDQLNPLSDLTQKRRLTGLGPGGLSLSNRKVEVRTIHPSHFGRFCLVETQEGQNTGIVNSPTLIRRLNRDGRLQSSITKIQNSWFQNFSKTDLTLHCVLRKDISWIIQFALGLLGNNLRQIQFQEFSTYLEIGIGQFTTITYYQTDLINLSPEQSLSLGPNLVPLIEHNDGNRVLIGANILRQALPTLNISLPRVVSRFDAYARKDEGQNLYACWSGLVCYVSTQRILIQSQIPVGTVVRHHRPNNFIFKKIISKKVGFAFLPFKNQNYSCCIEYRVGGTFYSNQATWRWQKSYVQEGIWVQSGDLLADGMASLHGQLAIGQNILLRYIPWDGLNFEDAIVASERLITNEIFTSNHIEEWETSLQRTPIGIESFVPFSTALVRCIKGKEIEFWTDFSPFLQKSDSFLINNLTNGKVSQKKKVFSLLKKDGSFSEKLNQKRNFPGKKWKIFKASVLIKKIRLNKIQLKIIPEKGSLNMRILSSCVCRIKQQYRVSIYNKKTITLYYKYLAMNYLYPNVRISYNHKNANSKILEKEKWNFIFPGYEILDYRGIIQIGAWVEPEQILALRIRPLPHRKLTPYERLLFDVLEQDFPSVQSTSLCVPSGIRGRILNVEIFPLEESLNSEWEGKVRKYPLKTFYFLFNKKNNTSKIFELYKKATTKERIHKTKFHQIFHKFLVIEKYTTIWEMINFQTLGKQSTWRKNSIVNPNVLDFSHLPHLERVIAFYVTRKSKKNMFTFTFIFERPDSIYYNHYAIEELNKIKNFLANLNTKISYFNYESNLNGIQNSKNDFFCLELSFVRIRITVAIYRRIHIGDKLSGRHGNKGILACLVPHSNMPYLPNGICLDLILNPLRIPSRINVGQIYETLFGLAGLFLGEQYLLPSFDERNQSIAASRSLVFEKLFEARTKTCQNWLFNPMQPGKIQLFDGRTSEIVNNDVAIGESYILKLVHIVDEKINARETGPYSLITQQPVRGRARNGGQRVGEIEMWALEGFGVSYVLQEILTVKSDDLTRRGLRLLEALIRNKPLVVELPDAFRVLACELQALCINILLVFEKSIFKNFLLTSFYI